VNASDWLELLLGLPTLLGGGGVVVAKLTRIAVAAETLADKIADVAGDVAKVGETVQDHENRLNKGGL